MFSNHIHILNFWSVLSHHKFIEMQHLATFIDWWAIIQPTTISNILFFTVNELFYYFALKQCESTWKTIVLILCELADESDYL